MIYAVALCPSTCRHHRSCRTGPSTAGRRVSTPSQYREWAPGVLAPFSTHALPSPYRARRAPITPISSPEPVTVTSKSLPALLSSATYTFRGGFLVRPFIIALTLGAAGAVFSWLEEDVPAIGSLVPGILFPSHSDPQVAQAILRKPVVPTPEPKVRRLAAGGRWIRTPGPPEKMNW